MKNILCFILGVGVGGAIGVLATKKMYEKVADDAMKQYAEYYENKIQEFNKQVNPVIDDDTILPKPNHTGYDNYEVQPFNPETVRYSNINKAQSVDAEIIKNPGCRDPFIISNDEYDNAIPEYDKVSLVYFAGSHTYTSLDNDDVYDSGALAVDEEHNIINNPDFSNVGDIIYIRNETLEIDYSIIYDDRDYDTFLAESDIVNNIQEPEIIL